MTPMRVSAALALLTATSCIPHVQLPSALPRRAPREHRVAFYQQFRPEIGQIALVTTFSTRGGRSTSIVFQGMQLANGVTVMYAEDLLPLVARRSPTALAVNESRAIAARQSIAGGTLFTVGLLGAVGTPLAVVSDPLNRIATPQFALSVTAATVGLIGGLIAVITYGLQGNRERTRGLLMFDTSLRQRLDLCGDGTEVGDCPELEPPQATPSVSSQR